jgi:signal transduction histidine kinase
LDRDGISSAAPHARAQLVRDQALHYAGALALGAFVVALRIAATVLTPRIHFTFYYFAVAASVWLFGPGPGVLTLVTCYVAEVFLLPYPMSFHLAGAEDQIAIGLSILVNLILVLIVNLLNTQRQRLRIALSQLETLKNEADSKREIAERADSEKAQLLALLAHEVRNPLNSIRMSSYMLRREGVPGSSTARIDNIDRATINLEKLTDRLFDSIRIDNGRLELKRERFDLTPVVRSVIEEMRPIAEARSIGVAATFEELESIVSGDADRVHDCIANVLANAIKFTPQGGKIEVALERREDKVELRISDTGDGIDPSFMPRLFERFAQDGTASNGKRGLGLGLFIVKNVVEQHGGTVAAASDGKGMGATFTLRLPPANTGNEI